MMCEICHCSGYHLPGCPEGSEIDQAEIDDMNEREDDRRFEEEMEESMIRRYHHE